MGKLPKVPTSIALESGKQSTFVKSIKKIKKTIKDASDAPSKKRKAPEAERGLVLLQHIPHGFYEEEIQKYFSQFGRVTNVRVLRSHKTGNSKGAAFIEFREPEVAKVVAETMDNYLMFKRRLVAKYIESEDRHSTLFQIPITARKYPKKSAISRARKAKNRNVSEEKHKNRMAKALKKLQKEGMLDCVQVAHLNFPIEGVEVNQLEQEAGETEMSTMKEEVVVEEATLKISKIEKTRRKTGIEEGKRKTTKSLKSIQKTKIAKSGLVLNPKAIEKIAATSKRGGKAKAALTIDPELVTEVKFVTKKKRKSLG